MTEEFYVPTDDKYKYVDRHCGVPYGGYANSIAEGARISVSGGTTDGSLNLIFQFIPSEGHQMRLVSDTLTIASSDGDVRQVALTVGGRNGQPPTSPTLPMTYAIPELHIANLEIEDFSNDQFTLVLPKIEVDSREYEVAPIVFIKVTKSGALVCIQ